MIQNKPLVTNMFTADPSAHVFDGKIYIYPSHDPGEDVENNDNGDQYIMRDYHVFEMADTENYPKDYPKEINHCSENYPRIFGSASLCNPTGHGS